MRIKCGNILDVLSLAPIVTYIAHLLNFILFVLFVFSFVYLCVFVCVCFLLQMDTQLMTLSFTGVVMIMQ